MYRRILVAVDGSRTSDKALVAATQLAREAGGQLRLVHVVDDTPAYSGFDFSGFSGEFIRVVRERGAKVLDDARAIAQAAGVEHSVLLFDKFGERLGETVAEEARRWKADLVVVGTHGRRGVGRMLLGSGAEQIVRLAPTHVLVVRNEEEQAPAATEGQV